MNKAKTPLGWGAVNDNGGRLVIKTCCMALDCFTVSERVHIEYRLCVFYGT